MKRKTIVALFTIFALLLASSLTVLADGNGRSLSSSIDGSVQTSVPLVDIINDGSFEAGNGSGAWTETSTNFGTPLCTEGFCGNGGGTAGPRTGEWWAWFGGIPAFEVGTVSQSVTMSDGDVAVLRFYVWNGASAGGGDGAAEGGADDFNVQMDGDMIFQIFEGDPVYADGYVLVELDVSAYADGNPHVLMFESTSNGAGTTNFSLDDVSLDTEAPTDVSLTDFGGSSSASQLPLIISLVALLGVGALFVSRRGQES